MLTERRSLKDYFINTRQVNNDEKDIEIATRGQLAFNFSVLPQQPNNKLRINIHDFEGNEGRRYYRYRNDGYSNLNFSSTHLDIPASELGKEVVTPNAFNQQTRAELFADAEWYIYAGSTEYEHTYQRKGINDRLEQHVKAVHLLPDFSPVIKTVAIRRHVLDDIGDLTYGFVVLQNERVTDRLDMRLSDGDPVFLAFLPDRVLGKTYGPGPEIVAETTYEELESAGIKAVFRNEADEARLSLTAGNLSFRLRLGKVLKPDYPKLLFSEKEEWITNSGISVIRLPSRLTN